jgi:CBS domain-containing protein
MKTIPVNPEQSPLVILDLLFKLKIKDVMSSPVITAVRKDSLRTVQHLMRDNRISGVPVAERGRLFGIASIDDIIRALEGGYIDDPVERHMTTQMVVLEDDMPLSFGISYFDKFKFGRFPVLNKENQLVGILSSRDVSASLLVELHNEYHKLEAKLPVSAIRDVNTVTRGFRVERYDFENAGKAAHAIKKILSEQNYPPALIRRVAVAAYEMEINLVVHSLGGTFTFHMDPEKVELLAVDEGPGIPNVEQAMQEGFTTANEWIKSLGFGAGMGLNNIRRNADEFDIQSAVGRGTTVRATILLPTGKDAPPQTP